jgi:hypothetical protein
MKKIFWATHETFHRKNELFVYMSTSSKIAIGVGLASGALLAAWLLTGTRKEKTKKLIVKGTTRLKKTLNTTTTTENQSEVFDDSEIHYV